MAVSTPAPSPVSLSHERAPRWLSLDERVRASTRIYDIRRMQRKRNDTEDVNRIQIADLETKRNDLYTYFIGTDSIDLDDKPHPARLFLQHRIVEAVGSRSLLPVAIRFFHIPCHFSMKSNTKQQKKRGKKRIILLYFITSRCAEV